MDSAKGPRGSFCTWARLFGLTLASLLSLVPLAEQSAHATGGHFLVEGTGIAPKGGCELEVWGQQVSGSPSSHILAAQPACSTQQGWEFTVPLEYDANAGRLATFGLDVKKVLSTDLYGGALALSVGVLREHQLRKYDHSYLNFAYGFEPLQSLTLHLNAGTAYDNIDKGWDPKWGFSATLAVNEDLELIAESLGVLGESPSAALGFRQAMSADIELDASFRRDFEQHENIVSVGFNFVF